MLKNVKVVAKEDLQGRSQWMTITGTVMAIQTVWALSPVQLQVAGEEGSSLQAHPEPESSS